MVSLHELFPLYVQVVLRARVDIAVPPRSLTLLSSKRTQQLLLPKPSTPTCESSMGNTLQSTSIRQHCVVQSFMQQSETPPDERSLETQGIVACRHKKGEPISTMLHDTFVDHMTCFTASASGNNATCQDRADFRHMSDRHMWLQWHCLRFSSCIRFLSSARFFFSACSAAFLASRS